MNNKKDDKSDNGLSLKLNGNRINLPIQGSTLLAVLVVAVKTWTAFGDMQTDVREMTVTVKDMTAQVGNMDDRMEDVEDAVDDMQAELKKTNETVHANSEMRDQIKNFEDRIQDLEDCIEFPKKCKL